MPGKAGQAGRTPLRAPIERQRSASAVRAAADTGPHARYSRPPGEQVVSDAIHVVRFSLSHHCHLHCSRLPPHTHQPLRGRVLLLSPDVAIMIHTAIGATASSAPQLGWQLAVFADLVSASSLVSRRAPTPGYTPDGQVSVGNTSECSHRRWPERNSARAGTDQSSTRPTWRDTRHVSVVTSACAVGLNCRVTTCVTAVLPPDEVCHI